MADLQQRPAEPGFWERAKTVLEVAGAVAALVAFVWLVGSAVMWLRFDKAGVPADAAVAVMSREQLFVVAFRLMILPALVAGFLAFVLWTWVEAQRRPKNRSLKPQGSAREPEVNSGTHRRGGRFTIRRLE
jgi:hypothetical protein